jgi:hypothetical protein
VDESRAEAPTVTQAILDMRRQRSARKAVVEGQAMVVYLDYLLKPAGRSLEDTPGLDLPDGRPDGERRRSIPSWCTMRP